MTQGPVRLYRGLAKALDWFRAEWQADLPAKLHESARHVSEQDHLGGPAMTERFVAYLGSGVLYDVDGEPVALDSPRGPLRNAWASMAMSSNVLERAGAHYLFSLACHDFDPRAAGLAMTPPIMPEHVYWYAEKAIGRLRERVDQLDRPWQLTGRYRKLEPRGANALG